MKKIFLKLYDVVLEMFLSANWEDAMFGLKVLAYSVTFLCIVAMVMILCKIRKGIKKSLDMIAEGITVEDEPSVKVVDEQWQAVLDKVEGDNVDAYKVAVLEADKIFDDLLKRMGCAGEDMGERLKQLSSEQVPNISDIWQAHKIRNRVAHEADFRVTRAQAKMVVETYRQAMQSLEAL